MGRGPEDSVQPTAGCWYGCGSLHPEHSLSHLHIVPLPFVNRPSIVSRPHENGEAPFLPLSTTKSTSVPSTVALPARNCLFHELRRLHFACNLTTFQLLEARSGDTTAALLKSVNVEAKIKAMDMDRDKLAPGRMISCRMPSRGSTLDADGARPPPGWLGPFSPGSQCEPSEVRSWPAG